MALIVGPDLGGRSGDKGQDRGFDICHDGPLLLSLVWLVWFQVGLPGMWNGWMAR
jgi:hypothetical protein